MKAKHLISVNDVLAQTGRGGAKTNRSKSHSFEAQFFERNKL